jgi:hypothetical protein
VLQALLAGDGDSVYAALPPGERDRGAREAVAVAVAGLLTCRGQEPPFISRAVSAGHVVVAAVFDPVCGEGLYYRVRACEVSVEQADGEWRPTLAGRPLLRCIS